MMSDLIYLLENGGLGLIYGTNLFKGAKAVLPKGDGPYVSIIETPGIEAEGTHNLADVPAYVRPSAQIVTRAKLYDVAEEMADRVWLLLYPTGRTGGGQFVNGTWWRSVRMVQRPFDLGLDDMGRPRLAFNINVVKRLSPATS